MVYVLPLIHFGNCLLHSDANLYANKSMWCDSDFCEGMWGGEGFSGDSVVKNLLANAGDSDSIPRLGRSSEGGNGNRLQYSYRENPMDRGSLRATVHGIAKSWTLRSDWHFQETCIRSLARTSSSILAWIIPWSEKPGRLQSMWSQRVSHTEWLSLTHSCLNN